MSQENVVIDLELFRISVVLTAKRSGQWDFHQHTVRYKAQPRTPLENRKNVALHTQPGFEVVLEFP